MKTIFALLDDVNTAQTVVQELSNRGFDTDEMNVVASAASAQDVIGKNGKPKGRGNQASALGQLLGHNQSLTLPDAGKIYASPSFANLLTRPIMDQDAGEGLAATLDDFDLRRDQVEAYMAGVSAGKVIFMMRSNNERANEALGVLRDANAKFVSSQTPDGQANS